MGKIINDLLIIVFIGSILLMIGGNMSCDDTNAVIIVEGPTKMLSEPECSFYQGVKEIAILNKGEKAQVIGVRYPKDCMVYKIKFADGRIGYITHGDSFKVIEKKKQ
jgi:hypothetical protein